MGNNSHNPGPWSVAWVRNTVYIKAQDTDRDLSICRVMAHRNSNNVAILVNAPEMLTVLEYAETVLSMAAANTQTYDGKPIETALADLAGEIKAIISKAKGA